MSLWGIKSLKELNKFMEGNEVLYDVQGHAYNVKDDSIEIVAVNRELFSERNKKTKKRHYMFEARLPNGSSVDLMTLTEYDEFSQRKSENEKDIKEMEKVWDE